MWLSSICAGVALRVAKPLLWTGCALFVGAMVPTTTSATTMLISFTGEASEGNSPATPISAQITFDPQLGTVTSAPIGSYYLGPMSARVEFGGETYSFNSSGHVQVFDNFPQNPADTGGADITDLFSVAMTASVPTGPGITHLTHIGFVDAWYSGYDFIHGNSLTQSFSVLGPDLDYPARFFDLYNGRGVSADLLDNGVITMHPVPEPGSLVLLITALGGLLLIRHRPKTSGVAILAALVLRRSRGSRFPAPPTRTLSSPFPEPFTAAG
jgi:hypothetical protein